MSAVLTVGSAILIAAFVVWAIGVGLSGIEHQTKRAADTLIDISSTIDSIESHVAAVADDVSVIRRTLAPRDILGDLLSDGDDPTVTRDR